MKNEQKATKLAAKQANLIFRREKILGVLIKMKYKTLEDC